MRLYIHIYIHIRKTHVNKAMLIYDTFNVNYIFKKTFFKIITFKSLGKMIRIENEN